MEDLITYSNKLILTQSEIELIEEAKNDPAGFRPLYNRYFDQIFRFVFHRIGDKQNASDITSEVFLKALTKIKTYVHKGLPLSAWLYRIAINECNEFFRKSRHQRLIVLDQPTIEHLAEEMGGPVSVELDFDKLANAMQKLNNNDVQIVQLRFFESMSFKEIGHVLDISENNSKVKLYRVLDKLRLKMGLNEKI